MTVSGHERPTNLSSCSRHTCSDVARSILELSERLPDVIWEALDIRPSLELCSLLGEVRGKWRWICFVDLFVRHVRSCYQGQSFCMECVDKLLGAQVCVDCLSFRSNPMSQNKSSTSVYLSIPKYTNTGFLWRSDVEYNVRHLLHTLVVSVHYEVMLTGVSRVIQSRSRVPFK